MINHAFFFDGLNHPRTMEKTRVVLPANVEERFTEEFDGIDRFYDKVLFLFTIFYYYLGG